MVNLFLAYLAFWLCVMTGFLVYKFFADREMRRYLADKPAPPVYRFQHPELPPIAVPSARPIRIVEQSAELPAIASPVSPWPWRSS